MKTDRIVEQHKAGLISRAEARVALDALRRWSNFNATYAEHPDSFTRWTNEGAAARIALATI